MEREGHMPPKIRKEGAQQAQKISSTCRNSLIQTCWVLSVFGWLKCLDNWSMTEGVFIIVIPLTTTEAHIQSASHGSSLQIDSWFPFCCGGTKSSQKCNSKSYMYHTTQLQAWNQPNATFFTAVLLNATMLQRIFLVKLNCRWYTVILLAVIQLHPKHNNPFLVYTSEPKSACCFPILQNSSLWTDIYCWVCLDITT